LHGFLICFVGLALFVMVEDLCLAERVKVTSLPLRKDGPNAWTIDERIGG
jgi:hypothetical protein